MSKDDWAQPDIVSSWVEEVGGPKTPCGDEWRCALVNPLAVATAVNLLRGGQESAPTGSLSKVEEMPVWMGLAQGAGSRSIAKSQRHFQKYLETLSGKRALDGLRVVDVGCGEGYLGRLLMPLGATYVGIDGSKPLLKTAKKRFGEQPNIESDAELIQADLDGPKLDSKTIARHLGDRFNLILGVVVLDHIEDPTGLLESLSTALSTVRFSSAALIVALNPAYFLAANGIEDLTKGVTGQGIRTEATIASTGRVVSCYLRSDRDHLCLFRRSSLRVIHTSPLGFWHLPFPEIEKETERGIPPFLTYVLAGRPPRASRAEVKRVLEEVLRGAPPNLLATVPEEQKKELQSGIKKIDLAEFEPEEVVLERGNLGGDLYLLVEGSAHLELPEGPDQLFGPGDLLGDLETGPDGRVGSYLYRVRAGKDGATLLRFEADLVERLIGRQAWLSSGLFEQLRDRLAINLWSFSHYDRPGRTVRLLAEQESNFKSQGRTKAMKTELSKTYTDLGLAEGDDEIRVVPKQLDIMSRLLLQGGEFERLDGRRDSRGRAAFLSMEVLKQRSPRMTTGKDEESRALRMMVLYGWVDAFLGSEFRESAPDHYWELWRDLVLAASEKFLRPVISSNADRGQKLWERISSMVSVGGSALASRCLEGMMLVFNKKTRQMSWTDDVLVLRTELNQCLRDPRWHEAVDRWLLFLCRANALWYDTTPALFFVRDSGALRTLALGSNQDLSRLVIARFRVCSAPRFRRLFKRDGSPRDWSAITANAAEDEPGRLMLYGREVNRFLLADLANCEGRLLFSGEPVGYPYPEAES